MCEEYWKWNQNSIPAICTPKANIKIRAALAAHLPDSPDTPDIPDNSRFKSPASWKITLLSSSIYNLRPQGATFPNNEERITKNDLQFLNQLFHKFDNPIYIGYNITIIDLNVSMITLVINQSLRYF